MSENIENKIKARRKLLKGIATGSGVILAGKTLPDNWSRPVVDSVLLPAHAQTSFLSFTGASNQASIDTDSRLAGVIDGLVNEAHAGPGPIEIELPPMEEPMFSAESCIQQDGPGTVRVDTLLSDGYQVAKLSASGVVVGGPPVPLSGSNCIFMIVVPPSNASLLDKTGLIPDAHAQDISQDATVEIRSVGDRVRGEYSVIMGYETIEIDLPQGDCVAPDCPVSPPMQQI